MSLDNSMDLSSIDPSSLSEADRRDLKQFIAREEQQAAVQGKIHQLTNSCFKTCITSEGSALASSGGKLDRNEEPCVRNCVNRFMDANLAVLKHLQELRG